MSEALSIPEAQKLMDRLAALLPDGVELVAIVVSGLDGPQQRFSTMATLPPRLAEAAILTVASRIIGGDAKPPPEARQ